MKYDCGFTKDDGWFRYKATAIIIENGSVLFAKTIGMIITIQLEEGFILVKRLKRLL